MILGVVVGLVFGALNFWLMTRIVQRLVQEEAGKKWKTGLFFFFKIALLLVTIGLILRKGYVTPLPFLAGFTASLIAGIGFVIWKPPNVKRSVAKATYESF